jgi:cytochrome c-type biogenesis protein CcmH
MILPLAFVVLTIAVVALLCLPLLRGVPVVADRGYFDRVVYRDQLKEVDRDLSRGVLNATEADAARLEIQRRLLAVQVGPPAATTSSARSPYLTGIVALCVIAGAAGLYWRYGAPSLPDAPFVAQVVQRTATPQDTQHLDMQQAAARLEQKLLADPSNAEGWALYARTESMLGDFKKAGAAYRHAIDLGQKTADVYASYGEMIVLTTEGIVSPAAQEVFNSALAADAKNDVARYYLALADGQAGNEKQAIDKWLALAADLPSDTPMREAIARGIAEAAKAGGIAAPKMPQGAVPKGGPNDDEVASAAQLPEGQRNELIRGMVAKLAERLQKDPDNVDGWAQLGRSYAVLGDTAKSVDAFDHAAKLKPDDVSIRLLEFQALIATWQPEDKLPPTAVAVLRQVAAKAPDQPEVLWYLGIDAAHDGNPEQARNYWTRLIKALPSDGADAKMVKQALDALPAK